jgi:hypothetical protein
MPLRDDGHARLQRGDTVRIRYRESDDWVPAFVALASDTNPSSVMLLLHSAVRSADGFIAKVLPVSIDYEAETVVSLFGDFYQIEVADAAAQ